MSQTSKPLGIPKESKAKAVGISRRPLPDRRLRSNLPRAGEDMLQAWEAFADVGKPQQRAVAVLNIGGVDHGMNKVSAGVRPDMALATFDLFCPHLSREFRRFQWF